MSQTKQIFGFGSLINTASLRKTAPHATDIRPTYVTGFRREFNLMDNISGWSDGKLRGIPYCALDIRKDTDASAKVNGVLFTVDADCLESLVKREHGYKLVETTVHAFESDEALGECLLFSACKNDGSYAFASPSQVRYLEVCLEGAKTYGEDFYQMFLGTTYIGDKRLADMPELIG